MYARKMSIYIYMDTECTINRIQDINVLSQIARRHQPDGDYRWHGRHRFTLMGRWRSTSVIDLDLCEKNL